jgi:hypothetical protein
MKRACQLVLLASVSWPLVANATQIVPGGVEYSNDKIEQNGKIQACVVTTAIISPPAPEIVNFQFLELAGHLAFKITAGDLNWTDGSMVAARIMAADFSTGEFNHPNAFTKSITPEGQLLAILTEDGLNAEFINAFFLGRYLIQFRRTDAADDRTYYIEQAPSRDVTQSFRECIHQIRGQEPG